MREYLSLEPLTTRIQTHRRYSEFPDDVEGAVLRALPRSVETDLLDVGCGTGAFLRTLTRRGHRGRLAGLDTSPAAAHALREVAGVTAVLGSVMGAPFGSASFDVVTARHMLYHVPDVRMGLAECRRILRPRGTFAAVVNHPDVTPRVSELVAGVVSAAGVAVPVVPNARVHSGNLPEMIASVFGAVDVHRYDNALVFDRPGPVVAFAVAQLSFYGVEPESGLRPELTRAIEKRVHAWFASTDGPWRDPKGYVVCGSTVI
ncbi:class I SAM-dependent methyltransferase [Actinoplanes sp. NPDC051346]|uniref:class I SAM-dependent methyltransferase n=1 Tax=Actinoplanes sp. NPDC051346 TaxID=3155048 RepID=UPI003420E800